MIPPAAGNTPPVNPSAGNLDPTIEELVPASRVAFPAGNPNNAVPVTRAKPINIPAPKPSSGGAGRAFGRLLLFLLFIAAVAAAFYGGTRYQGVLPFGLSRPAEVQPVSQPAPVKEDPVLTFEKARREVDRAPAEWLSGPLPLELARQNILNPIDSVEPQFLYLYGRARLLAGNNDEAGKAFEQAIARADQSPNSENATIRKEAVLGLAAAALKANSDTQRARTHLDELGSKPLQPTK
jgi:hypothetical protein